MHEFSIASQILDTVREHAEEHGADRVEAIEIEVGEASHLNVSQLRTCLEAASAETIAEDAAFDLQTVTPYAECDACGWSGEPDVLEDALAFAPNLRCPECDERIDLTRGKECRLMTITIPGDEDADGDDSTASDEAGADEPATTDAHPPE
jgi:hydrogenase nickel incorporation protein HypA/HybF